MAVEMDFARGGDQALFGDDFDAEVARLGEALEAVAEIDFLAGEQFVAESAEFAEKICARENVGTGGPFFQAADGVPEADENFQGKN